MDKKSKDALLHQGLHTLMQGVEQHDEKGVALGATIVAGTLVEMVPTSLLEALVDRIGVELRSRDWGTTKPGIPELQYFTVLPPAIGRPS